MDVEKPRDGLCGAGTITGGHTRVLDTEQRRRQQQEQGERESALAAVPLLAKHEQKPPSAEQPFSECRGGEEQGTYGDFCVSLLAVCVVLTLPAVVNLANLAC